MRTGELMSMADSIEQYMERGRRLIPDASESTLREAAVMTHFLVLAIETTTKAMLVTVLKSKKSKKKRGRRRA